MKGIDPNPYPIAKVEIIPGGCILHKFVSYWSFEFYAGMVPGEYKSLDALTAGTLIIMEHSSIELSELRHIQLSKGEITNGNPQGESPSAGNEIENRS